MVLDQLIPILGILLAMIPVAGFTLVLTLRLAVRPLVETLVTSTRDSGGHQLTDRLSILQEELETLAREVRELRSVRDFDHRLLATSGDLAPIEPQAATRHGVSS